jgi:phospholipid/cholesterol/gamma-HCH transport system substrate-binding protein
MTRTGATRLRLLAPVLALSLAGATAGCGLFSDSGAPKHLTAHFARTVGLYKHSDVRVLGVRIGQVTAIKPEGRTVRVEMEYDGKYKLPVDAKAVVVAPSIVSDRYVQIIPVWMSGVALPPLFDLSLDGTADPV